MKKLRILVQICLIVAVSNSTDSHYFNRLSTPLNKELQSQQLLLFIQNTPNPSQKLLANWLKIAFEQNYINIINYILCNTNININTQDELENSWLHYAVLSDDPRFVKILLHKGIDPNIQNKFGNTALHENAIHNPNLKIIRLLLLNGIKPGIENYEKETALLSYQHSHHYPKKDIIRALKRRCMCYYL